MIEKTEYKNIGETVFEGTLDNGLRIRVIPKPGFSSFYAVYGTKYGGAMRRFEVDGVKKDTPAGVAHFLEHKMFDLPGGENALTILSSNGADPNAFTSSCMTCYYFSCTDLFEENLRTLLHFVSTPYFTPETVQKEQGIIGQEIQMVQDSPGNRIYYGLLGLLYENHPIKEEVAGTIDSIAEITDQTLYDCHKVFYAPSNMCLCVEGDVDVERVFEIAAEELPKEKSPVPHADYGKSESLYPVSKRFELEMPVSAPQFLIGSKVKGDSFRDRLVSSLCTRLLFGSSSPFYNRLYSEGILNRDFDADVDFSADTATFMVGGESDRYDTVYEELVREVENLNIDDRYFQRIKKSAIGGKLRSMEVFDDVCVSTLFGVLDGYNYFDSMEEFEKITKEDCENWIKLNLCEEKLAMAVVKPLKAADR